MEDDVDLKNILVDGLSHFNYQVFQADDGERAVELILDARPDLVLLDLLLPKLISGEVDVSKLEIESLS